MGDFRTDADFLAGRSFFGGLDLAGGTDINASCLLFPNVARLSRASWLEKLAKTGLKTKDADWESLPIHACLWRFWIPEAKVKEKEDRVDYRRWAEDGWIRVCGGRSVDHAWVIEDVFQDCTKYKPVEINYDARLAEVSNVVKSLTDRGVKMTGFGQGITSVSEPTKEAERLINNFQFEHFGNPVAAWMMGNTVIKRDPVGNIRLDKDKSPEKIDGIAALINAVAGAMAAGWKDESDDDAVIRSW